MRQVMLGSFILMAGCGAATSGADGEPGNNQAPIADAGSDQFGASTTQEVPLDGSQSYDPEGHDLHFSWAIESAPAGSNAPLLNAANEHAILVPDVEGTYYLRLVVHDGWKESEPDVVQVVVDNSAPVAVAGGDREYRTNCGGVELSAFGSMDPNGDSMQYEWTIAQRPSGSTAFVDDPSAMVTFFVPDRAGLYRVELVVSDGRVASPPASFTVEVEGEPLRTGNVLVVNNVAPYDILEFSPNGGYLGKFVDGSTLSGTSAYRNLYGITQLANGSILVSAAVSQRVFRFSASGAFQGEWTSAYSQGNVSVPQGLFETPSGRVLIATWRTFGVGRHAIQEFSSGGAFQGDFKTNPTINSPRNVILACNGEYLVSNSENDTVDRYDESYDYRGAFISGVNTPTGLWQTQDGTILVTRFANSTVERYLPDGQYDGSFATATSGLSAPSGIVQLGNGRVVVTSTGNDRVRWYDPSGALIGDLGAGAPLADPIGVTQKRN